MAAWRRPDGATSVSTPDPAAGRLARHGEAYTASYLREIVDAVGARRVIPIHHDDLTAPSDGPFVPQPRWLDDVGASLARLQAWAAAEPGRSLALLPKDRPVILFGG